MQMSHDVVAQAETGQNVTFTGSLQEFVTMRVGGQLFGISVLSVQDVLRKQRIAKIPLAPAVIAGSLNLRGRIVTVINMRRRLSLPPAEDDSSMMNVVVDYNNELFSL
ncbi:MAG: chemotaxis protein CheW, partial [Rickettsiales bacterium]|nr:chemotaxis protein CheW [Rickettsiales bacterium]